MTDGPTAPTTASTGVQTTYYDFPVIKAPHWRWLIIVYFFLAGIAGASASIASLANLFSRSREVERTARYLSFSAFLPCPLLLILDLGRPERFLHMLRIVKLKSPMSLGSWALSAFGLFATVSTGLQLFVDLRVRGGDEAGSSTAFLRGTRRIAGILGLPFSLFLSGYTGVLLAATNVPLWWRSSPFIAPAFVSSAYSTSFAAISLLLGRVGNPAGDPPTKTRASRWPLQTPTQIVRDGRADTERRLARAESICLATEIGLIATMLIRLGRIGRPLTTGRLGMIFWPVTVVGGLITPLILQLSGPATGRETSSSRRTVSAALALIGGFSLRTLMIFAGRESARRPADYFEMTRGTATPWTRPDGAGSGHQQ